MKCSICEVSAAPHELAGGKCLKCVSLENIIMRLQLNHLLLLLDMGDTKVSPTNEKLYSPVLGETYVANVRYLVGSEQQMPWKKHELHYRQAIYAFSERMYAELVANDAQKGDFLAWVPTPEGAAYELDHHVNKLKTAINESQLDQVGEYTADLANIALGISRMFGAKSAT